MIFNPYHYHIDKNWEQRKILRLNTAEYNGEALETPINASSLSAMFSWMAIPKNIKFSKRFDLSNIKDMSLMFAGTRISQDTDIFESFSTDKVLNTRYMFYKAILPAGSLYICFRIRLPSELYLQIRSESLFRNHPEE